MTLLPPNGVEFVRHATSAQDGAMLPQWIASTIVGMVAVAFAVNFFAQFVLDTWTPDPYVYGAFMMITPLVLGLRRSQPTVPSGEPLP